MAAAKRISKLNLTRAHAISFDVHFRLPESAVAQGELGQVIANYGGCSLQVLGRKRDQEFVLVSVTQRGKEREYYGRIRFDTEPPWAELAQELFSMGRPDGMRVARAKGSAFLAAFAATGASVELHCRARFAYPFSYGTPVIQVPSRPMISTALPFDEYRGFRAAKLGPEGDVLYSVILDSFDLKTITHEVLWYSEAKLSEPFIRPTFKEGQRISLLFFTEGAEA